ncbi:uncharacterized protein LOC133297384 isoform X2 [Gastrolobium bilobum]|uniref:uncharacterized protein LOC133297384 isoform X2 n=1 Tax=Gastrolobium bilobum TaxID=150636 RepID=UPI002AB1177A|nr:uncharacterized protein LOC133297384 isoform X2 [Gastrolobium bilobum]
MTMPEQKNKKVSFTEEDAAALTLRYDETTVLTLLQEVANYPYSKIDWNDLVKKTSTGISNAREYQMLWRHLAYHDALEENFEDGAEPLDDDSDLDCEMEALPPVSVESASEASACVKVMIASRTLSESTPSSSTIEAPLTINVPVCHSSRTPNESSQPNNLMQGSNIIFPVTVQRQTLPTASSTDGIETKGSVGGNMASKRKRKAWSEEEDMQLRAAVQKWGEGNWATMAKGDNFPIKRSPTQLAQRWSILRKKDGSANSGTILTSTQYTTAEQLATRHSLSLALDMPFKKLTAPGMTDPARTSTSIKNQVQTCNATEGSTVHNSFVPPSQHPSQQALLGSCGSSAKPKLVSGKSIPKCNPMPNTSVKSTTVVSPLNTGSQHKVAQARNVIVTGNSLTKTSVSGGLPNNPKVQSNVPYVCTSSTAASALAVISPGSCSSTVKGASYKVENSATTLSRHDKSVTSVVEEVPLKQVNPTEKFKAFNTIPTPKEMVQEDENSTFTAENRVMAIDTKLDKGSIDFDKVKSVSLVKITSEDISEDKAVPQNLGKCEETGAVKNSNFTFSMEINENNNLDKGNQDLDHDKRTNSINGSSDNQNMNVNQVNLASVVLDECSQGLELSS